MRSRSGRVLAVGAAGAALFGLGYIGTTWYRYGKSSRGGPRNPLLDRFLPNPEVAERHETEVRAPAEATWVAVRELDLHASPLIRAIFLGRELLMHATPPAKPEPRPFLAEVLELGWGILAEEPGHELVMGAVTQPWEANVTFRALPADEFAGFREPGYAKIVWNVAVQARGSGCIFRTETRVVTTDPVSRARFRRYWCVVSPGILLIRRETLRLVKRAAEREWMASSR